MDVYVQPQEEYTMRQISLTERGKRCTIKLKDCKAFIPLKRSRRTAMELERAQIRLTGLEIRDYKNVKHGFLSLENPGSGYEAGILGLYGQNGSGKTAVIDALSLLKLALSGESIPARLGEYIHVDAANAAFSFTFRLREEEEETRTIYTLKLKKKQTDRGEEQRGVSGNCGVLIYGESLSWNGSGRMQMLLEAGQEEPFGPKTRCKALIGGERTALVDALVARKLADAQGTSFFFGEAFETLLSQKAPDSIEKRSWLGCVPMAGRSFLL